MADSLDIAEKVRTVAAMGRPEIGVRMTSPVRRTAASEASNGIDAAGADLSHPAECLRVAGVESRIRGKVAASKKKGRWMGGRCVRLRPVEPATVR